jgi:hypothetical protein
MQLQYYLLRILIPSWSQCVICHSNSDLDADPVGIFFGSGSWSCFTYFKTIKLSRYSYSIILLQEPFIQISTFAWSRVYTVLCMLMALRSPLLDSRSTLTAATSTHSVFTSEYRTDPKKYLWTHTVLLICDILIWIQVSQSNGSGSGRPITYGSYGSGSGTLVKKS